ncbi:OmpH family outer membrane protein [uncultured Tateyamaria sp.]|uniref:OmpH family outer membrane protein n=1 Tax=uncultured Tateyamaria sp. TaxID=455651 RepID=UPI00262E98FB|nr:OmpH family outer membrane protein [uncultured Tateyamaria sp.]
MGSALRLIIVTLALFGASVSFAQDVRSPILTIDSDRFYRASDFGQRVLREIAEQTDALAEDNRVIEETLETEELALTEQRADLPPEDFRALADAFDARVQSIREQREAENRAIANQLEENRDRFLNAAAPVLEAIMREAGAAVILERRSVFISANAIDITDTAVERMNEALGDGVQTPD